MDTLDLVFKDEDNKSKSIRISNPKPGLKSETVLPVMQKILEAKFLVNKMGAPMATISAAKLRNVTDLLDKQQEERIPDPDPDEEQNA